MVAKHYEQKLRIIGTRVKWKCLYPLIRFFIGGSKLKGKYSEKNCVFGTLTWIYKIRNIVDALKSKQPVIS